MNIKDLLLKELMILDLQSTTKSDSINEMVAKLKENDIISDENLFRDCILKREERGSTGLGEGVAMPHAKTTAVNKPAVLFAKSKKGVDYAALDDEPVFVFFMIAASEGAHDSHIETLAELSKMLIKNGFIDGILECNSAEEVYALIDKYEGDEEEEKQVEETKTEVLDTNRKKIVAVTACPTGIAHTYMAEEALVAAANKLGIDIKVETNGANGVKNALTKDDIDRADGVIVAVNKAVPTGRFNDKRAIMTSAQDAIKNAETLINNVLSSEAKVFHSNESDTANEEAKVEKKSLAKEMYDAIMSGVSNMLPFVIAGGILLALAFVVERFFGDNTVFQTLMTFGGGAFNFLLPILAGFMAMSLADKPAFMPGVFAGYLANAKGAGFLGALIGGFVAGYGIRFIKKMTRSMPRDLEGMKSMIIFPLGGLLLTGIIMTVAVIPVFSVINDAMNNFLSNMGTANAVLLGAVLGAMMSADMGGPINKAAYTFSIGVFTSTGSGAYMAAVMAGGMVPPLALAIAMTLFKNKFTDKEKQATISNYILGLSFITEGAIPFAAKEPVKVIGSCIVGSSIAGGLTQFWKVTAPAPHGGIFVIPAMPSVSSAVFFVLSILIGAFISAFIFACLRKKIN